jgi:hypothetical protein
MIKQSVVIISFDWDEEEVILRFDSTFNKLSALARTDILGDVIADLEAEYDNQLEMYYNDGFDSIDLRPAAKQRKDRADRLETMKRSESEIVGGVIDDPICVVTK